MRVLHVDTARGWRGGQNQVLLAARGMRALGHEARLACRAGSELERRARAAGVPVTGLRFAGDLGPLGLLGLWRLVRRFRPEVLQLHDPHAVSAGWLAAAGVPRVATRRVDFPLQGPLSRRKYAGCRRVVAVSAAIREVLLRDGLAAERLRLVYEGVPDRPPQPGGREALRELGVPDGALVVGNVAALTDHKDQRTLLRAAAEVLRAGAPACFVVVGEGELRAPLEQLARELELGPRCLFAGFRADLDRLLPALDVFCLSSHMEGLGTSLLDAMCFERPIVATAAGGIPEAVEDGVTGRLAPPRDPSALAAALLEALGSAERRRAWGAAGRARFERLFTAERMVAQSLAVYAEAA